MENYDVCLGYWNIRGLAQPIRMMLAFTDTKFEDKQYEYGPAPEYNRNSWLNRKNTIGLDFPNLPYLIDGDLKLTQSLVIMRYLARKNKLEPETDTEKIRADMTEQQIVDFRSGLTSISYDPDFEKLKGDYLKELPNKLELFSKYLGDRKFFAGDKLTYVDFLVYEAFDQHKVLEPTCLDKFQNLKDFIERFEKLPKIEKYMNSDVFMKWPINGDMAYFGSRRIKKSA